MGLRDASASKNTNFEWDSFPKTSRFVYTPDEFTFYRNAWNIMDFIVVTSG